MLLRRDKAQWWSLCKLCFLLFLDFFFIEIRHVHDKKNQEVEKDYPDPFSVISVLELWW
jgi:hypothetical protein